MLTKVVRDSIRDQIVPEFESRSAALPAKVEAAMRRLQHERPADGGHVDIGVNHLLADEMRERTGLWGQAILRVLIHARVAPSEVALDDFRAELQHYVNRDTKRDLPMIRERFPRLRLIDDASIIAARQIEVEKQLAVAALNLPAHEPWHEWKAWPLVGGGIAFLAALVAILEYLGVMLR